MIARRIVSAVMAGLVLLAGPVSAQGVLKAGPLAKELAANVTCPVTAKVETNSTQPGGWTALFTAFNLPFFAAGIMSGDAANDYLKCNYGAAANQFAISKTVKKGSCTVNDAKNGFVCK